MTTLFFEKGALSKEPNEFAYFNNISDMIYEKNVFINTLNLKIIEDESNLLPPYVKIEEVRFEINCERLIDKHSSTKTGNVKPYKLDELKEIAKQNKINVNNINKNQLVKLLKSTFCKFND